MYRIKWPGLSTASSDTTVTTTTSDLITDSTVQLYK
jgi:hypothetical protein